ncbi:MAG: DUF4401 domain-containing protein [Caldilineaceae bacterium]
MDSLLEELLGTDNPAAPSAETLAAALAPDAGVESTPWFVKALVGIAAWVAAILLGVFFSLLNLIDTGEEMVMLGGVILVVAVGLKWWARSAIFWGQLSFALVLAGEGLILVGIGTISQETTTVAWALLALEALLFLIYPDALHRILSLLAMVGALLVLFYEWHQPQLLHLLIVGAGLGTVAVGQAEFALLSSRFARFVSPLRYGLAVTLAGLCIFALGDWYGTTAWWISTAGLALVLLYLVSRILRDLEQPLLGPLTLWAVGAIALLCIPAYQTPGLFAALILLMVARWRATDLLLGLATIFLLFFVGAYYYNLNITLLNKSYILMGSGLALLVAWWGLRRVEKTVGSIQ